MLGPVIYHLSEAKKNAANDTQKKMLEAYIDHFDLGELRMHKESQKHWIKDTGPAVETNIGFIENYRDGIVLDYFLFLILEDFCKI